MCAPCLGRVVCMPWLLWCSCVLMSAYEVTCTGACGMSDVYTRMLISMGERTSDAGGRGPPMLG